MTFVCPFTVNSTNDYSAKKEYEKCFTKNYKVLFWMKYRCYSFAVYGGEGNKGTVGKMLLKCPENASDFGKAF